MVYLEGEAERQEYVLAEDGLIWRGSHNRLRPTVWKYAQFERDILDCALHLMNYVGKVRVSGRNDPVVITRCLSAAVSHLEESTFPAKLNHILRSDIQSMLSLVYERSFGISKLINCIGF